MSVASHASQFVKYPPRLATSTSVNNCYILPSFNILSDYFYFTEIGGSCYCLNLINFVPFLRNLLILNISASDSRNISAPASKMIGVKLNNREALYREVTSFLNMKENGELRWCNTPSIFK